MRVLLIEPDRVLARTYQRYLLEQGYIVSHVASAQSAVHAIDMQKPDLIILELQLGGHNGIEFLYELRSYADLQFIPIIVHSFINRLNFEMSKDMLQALGVVEYLYKPATNLVKLELSIANALQPATT